MTLRVARLSSHSGVVVVVVEKKIKSVSEYPPPHIVSRSRPPTPTRFAVNVVVP